jgi:hypothetical protein
MKLRSLAESWQCDRYCPIGSTIPLRPSRRRSRSSVALDPEVFPAASLRSRVNLELCPLVELRLLQSLTRPCRHRLPGLATSPAMAPLLGFSSPTTPEAQRSHHPGAIHTPFVALSGFLTLSAPCSPLNRPTLFHAGNVLGVSPSEPFPLEEPYHLSVAVALLMFTTHPLYYTTRSCHAKRAETRCSHPDVVRLLLPWHPPASVHPPPRHASSSGPVADRSRPRACRTRHRQQFASPGLPRHRSGRTGLALLASGSLVSAVVPPRTHARGFPSTVTNTPRGWPGLLIPDRGCRSTFVQRSETPPVPAPRPLDARFPASQDPLSTSHLVVRSLGRRPGSPPAAAAPKHDRCQHRVVSPVLRPRCPRRPPCPDRGPCLASIATTAPCR